MKKFFEGTCVDYTFDGLGICKTEQGIPVFCRGMIRQEVALISYKETSKSYYEGQIERFINLSPHRVIPPCKLASICGGCQLMHMAYSEQCNLKRNYVADVLKKVGGIDIEPLPIIKNDNPYRYRNKVQVSYAYDFKGNIISGFYAEKTHQVINRDVCLLESEIADQIASYFKELLIKYHIEPYDSSSSKIRGCIKHLLVRTSSLNEVMVVIVSATASLKKKDMIVKNLLKRFPAIKTIVHNINPTKGNKILGDQEYVLFGEGYINDILCGLKFKISPKSFYQVNHDQTEKLYNAALQMASLKKDDYVLDAYCGIGTIGLCASRYVKKVVGVEIVEDAIKNARENAKNNKITNARFYVGDASSFMEQLKKKDEHFDVAFIDPPRGGCDMRFIKTLMEFAPERIIYISCNPATLARDLKTFTDKYEVKKVQPLDMFSNTYHVETVVLMSRKDK